MDSQTYAAVAVRCLAIGYQPNETPEQYALLVDTWVAALAEVPVAYAEKAALQVIRSATRRPTPGEVLIVARRLWADDNPRQIPPPPPMQDIGPVEHRVELVREVMAKCFPPKEAEIPAWMREDYQPEPHWTQTFPADHHWRDQLRRDRDANPLVQAAREEQARRRAGLADA